MRGMLIYTAVLFAICSQLHSIDGGLHPKYSVKAYRLAKHQKPNFHRLVIELEQKQPGITKPTVNTKKLTRAGTYTVMIHDLTLVGAIPEYALSDYIRLKRGWFSFLSIDATPNEVLINISLEDDGNELKVAWADGPARIILDSYENREEMKKYR